MRIQSVLLPVMLIFLLVSCGKRGAASYKRSFYRMDTYSEVTLVVEDSHARGAVLSRMRSILTNDRKKRIDSAWRLIDSLMADWEIRFSQTKDPSEVLALNSRGTRALYVSRVLGEMLRLGIAYGDTLGGMFDPTILPIKELWGFGEREQAQRVPSRLEIDHALAKVGYGRVHVGAGGDTVLFDDDDAMVDVGGIAKGFVLREIGGILDKAGFGSYLLVSGGDILSKGRRPDGAPWRIGIQHPRDSRRLLGTLALDNGAVVTSGDYERYWEKDGQRYHHIFDPGTGCCCRANRSVTVWSMDPIEADILSTGLFCMPGDSVLAFVNARPRLECVVVDSTGNISVSDGWTTRLEIVEQRTSDAAGRALRADTAR